MIFCIPDEHLNNIRATDMLAARDPAVSVMEEAGELITAVAKHEGERGEWSDRINHISEEFTHLLISMARLSNQIGIDQNDIRRQVESKAIKDGWDISQYCWDK